MYETAQRNVGLPSARTGLSDLEIADLFNKLKAGSAAPLAHTVFCKWSVAQRRCYPPLLDWETSAYVRLRRDKTAWQAATSCIVSRL